ncbi:MAG: DUF192 domain-containing protein [Coriobacteriia bacterium]|nr:DUF192 domain-containing protein [Coriobacteriia bacterium]
MSRTHKTCMKVKTVTSYYGRMKGLLGTRQHQLNFDVLHLIPCKGVHTFGMQYALDLAFLNRQGQVIALYRNVVPNRVCQSPPKTHSVLERPASKNAWLLVGDHIENITAKLGEEHEPNEDMSHLPRKSNNGCENLL